MYTYVMYLNLDSKQGKYWKAKKMMENSCLETPLTDSERERLRTSFVEPVTSGQSCGFDDTILERVAGGQNESSFSTIASHVSLGMQHNCISATDTSSTLLGLDNNSLCSNDNNKCDGVVDTDAITIDDDTRYGKVQLIFNHKNACAVVFQKYHVKIVHCNNSNQILIIPSSPSNTLAQDPTNQTVVIKVDKDQIHTLRNREFIHLVHYALDLIGRKETLLQHSVPMFTN
ncbi:hypothetical protein RFI_04548 [Reticulomyxa filosa]|uniref:Uncharacterized protein n=1 Tax=Reticulomyxa filosa TaxID=46433 RepID=X6P363_RETFI|nr:hypothetical protein RFI_04548 [Reticulomyxa filosa]|eukprot:ETO32568.1 hypothetical protein RFI_04548 [Reticulomyxa filosa]